jgi:hypothetical protein
MSEKIEQGVPIPRTRGQKYMELDTLEVGESFLFRGVGIHSIATPVFWRWKKYGKKFTCRSLPEGTRVWRVN